MTSSSPDGPHDADLAAVNSTLALLRAAEPRMGLEQRVLARLATATPAAPAWYHPFASARWTLTAASVVVVAATVTYGVQHHRAPAPAPTAIAARAPRPARREPVATAASVAEPEHPLQQAPVPARHRGSHRGFRARHARTVLPPGTVAPSRPQLLSAPQ